MAQTEYYTVEVGTYQCSDLSKGFYAAILGEAPSGFMMGEKDSSVEMPGFENGVFLRPSLDSLADAILHHEKANLKNESFCLVTLPPEQMKSGFINHFYRQNQDMSYRFNGLTQPDFEILHNIITDKIYAKK